MSDFTFTIGHDDAGKAVRMHLPTLIETRLFDLASSGGGKSYALRVLIEKTAGHVQWLIIDPEGEFSSLREKFDFLLVGKDGEVPVDVRSAKLLARKIMETRVSVIIDLYGLINIREAWVADFLESLMTLPKDLWSPVMVAIDEAHKFARESVKGKAGDPPARARQAVITMSDSGRKQSRGCVIATQRLTKLAADARAELRNNLIGLAVQDLDRDRAGDILGIPKNKNEALRELNAGEFYAFGPSFVSHRGVFRMKVDPAITRHPKPGEGRLLAVPKASEAIRTLMDELGDISTQAQEEQDALTAAQQEVIRLRRELVTRPVQVQPSEPEIQYVDKPVLNGEVPMLRDAVAQLSETLAPFQRLPETLAPLNNLLSVILGKIDTVQNWQPQPERIVSRTATQRTPVPQRTVSQPSAYRQDAGDMSLPVGEKKILKACAQFPNGATRAQLTVITGYKRSSRDAYVARLSQKGFVAIGDRISATEQGIVALGSNYEPLPTGGALQDYWLANLPAGEKAIFEVALEVYPEWVDRDLLSERTGYKRSSRDAYIQRMLAKEIIEARTGSIRASDELF